MINYYARKYYIFDILNKIKWLNINNVKKYIMAYFLAKS
jgi:hypothetical protein